MKITHNLDTETAVGVIDMVAKVLLLRTGRETLVTWDELERAADTKCTIEKTMDGVVFRTDKDVRQ